VVGRFLQARDTPGLRAEGARALAEGAAGVFVSEGSLGDPVVLAAGLGPELPGVLLGARIRFDPLVRHPAMLARDLASLDLVCGGRSVLCFAPPFTPLLAEAIFVCRALWGAGEARHDGPSFSVRGATNRSRPAAEGSPLVALDLTAGDDAPDSRTAAPDLLLLPVPDEPAACRLERV
jgi:alkanesulfonate monooxygenase SsuD/methylene tetrahydromethanopterin reductase-like flavin-dependent oxidoreductase (luciferase family)